MTFKLFCYSNKKTIGSVDAAVQKLCQYVYYILSGIKLIAYIKLDLPVILSSCLKLENDERFIEFSSKHLTDGRKYLKENIKIAATNLLSISISKGTSRQPCISY